MNKKLGVLGIHSSDGYRVLSKHDGHLGNLFYGKHKDENTKMFTRTNATLPVTILFVFEG